MSVLNNSFNIQIFEDSVIGPLCVFDTLAEEKYEQQYSHFRFHRLLPLDFVTESDKLWSREGRRWPVLSVTLAPPMRDPAPPSALPPQSKHHPGIGDSGK